MNTFTKTTSILAVLMLTACGGGGGGSDSSSGAAQVDEPVSSEESVSVQEVSAVQVPLRSMQELVVPDDFNYNPTQSIEVLVDISAISTERAYISIYSVFDEGTDGTRSPDYAHRVANGALSNGMGELQVTYAQEYTQLLAEIWFYDGSDPIQHIINRENTQIVY